MAVQLHEFTDNNETVHLEWVGCMRCKLHLRTAALKTEICVSKVSAQVFSAQSVMRAGSDLFQSIAKTVENTRRGQGPDLALTLTQLLPGAGSLPPPALPPVSTSVEWETARTSEAAVSITPPSPGFPCQQAAPPSPRC